MTSKVLADNAIILAAGTSSRFAPLSRTTPKGLLTVKGQVLIERQIEQLQQAGISDIVVVVGYMADRFAYLADKYGVCLVANEEYRERNNHSSLWAAKEYLGNSYVCSSDNYFAQNPFTKEVDGAYYAAVYAEGHTDEWCMTEDEDGFVDGVTIGGENAWYMMGHTFWDVAFSRRFLAILEEEYHLPETKDKLWEAIYKDHLDQLKMRIQKYPPDVIYEFDSLDELRAFDEGYVNHSGSPILEAVAKELGCREGDITGVRAHTGTEGNEATGFSFRVGDKEYHYDYEREELTNHGSCHC